MDPLSTTMREKAHILHPFTVEKMVFREAPHLLNLEAETGPDKRQTKLSLFRMQYFFKHVVSTQ